LRSQYGTPRYSAPRRKGVALGTKLLVVVGTRPEAIKMAPVILALRREPGVAARLLVTGQHRDMVAPTLSAFGLAPDIDLALMTPDQSLNAFAGRAIEALDGAIADAAPDRVLVQGDTSSALAAAIAAFHRRVPVGHVEAGLRTRNLASPFPEEMNRRTIDGLADLLFAPTASARAALEEEAVAGRILVTGNSGIDALQLMMRRLDEDGELRAAADAVLPGVAPGRKLVAVTVHRRESFGEGLRGICEALATLAGRDGIDIVYPVHLNPAVREPVAAALGEVDHIHLVPPLEHPALVRLMQRADLLLTDSGGIQEEAPSLGTPVLVLRDVTERPEAVEAGIVKLVGTDPRRIVAAAEAALAKGRCPPASNPYGDGKASGRIVDALLGRPVSEFR
jgi:UDP-N-acetylglucosamine 2-epimerase (non-hydrolysing)